MKMMFNPFNAKLQGKSKGAKNPVKSNASIIADLTSGKSLLFKMVAMFLFLIIVPVTVNGIISTRTSSKNLKENAESSLIAATRLMSDYFDEFLEKGENLALQISANPVIAKYSGTADEAARQEAAETINKINISTLGLNARILFENGELLGYDVKKPIDMAKVKQTSWYERVSKAGGKAVLVNCSEGLEEAFNNYDLSVVMLYTEASGNTKGVIIINIENMSIYSILSGIDLGMGDSTYFVTREGKVLAKTSNVNQEELAGRQYFKDLIEHAIVSESECFYSSDGKEKYLVSFKKSPKTGIMAVTVVPSASVTKGVTEILKTTIHAGILFIILAAALGLAFSFRMASAMKGLMHVMARAEEGDLTSSLTMKRKDEIGALVNSFNRMMGKIRDLVAESKRAAQEVGDSSEQMAGIAAESARVSSEIAHAIQEVASGAANQAVQTENSVKGVTELAERITGAVEMTAVMESDAQDMKALSGSGIMVIEDLSNKTSETNAIAADVVTQMDILNGYVKNINVITNVLRGIADQTNLLALNAAIEAARAGDSGRGFAVVAEEIRKLAEMSNQHTRDIQKHIENVFRQSQNSAELVSRAEASIREQSEMVERTAVMFEKINATTTRMVERINAVDNMIRGMDSCKEMVMSGMENIAAVSEEMSASTQEVSASAQEQLASVSQLDYMAKQLHGLAEGLLEKIGQFKV